MRSRLLPMESPAVRRRQLPAATVLLVVSCVMPGSRAFRSGAGLVPQSSFAATWKMQEPIQPPCRPSRPARVLVMMAGRGGEEWEKMPGDLSRENPWGHPSSDDWYMNTARIQYLREMERLGQELHELTSSSSGTPLGVPGPVQSGMVAGPLGGGSAPPPGFDEVASQEQIRALETQVAEKCVQNWREEPVFCKPVGYVPGGRKVQAVRLSNKRVMYGSDSGHVGLANTINGKDIFGQQAHSALVTALDYDASTGWMVSAADDGVVVVYREIDEHVEVLHRLRSHSNRVVCAEILDHMLAMTASLDGKIVVFNLQTGATVLEVWATDMVLAASVCKGYIFVGLMSGVCEAFSIRNGGRSAFRYIAQRCPIRSLKAFPTASSIKLVAGGQDGLIRQFHVRPVMSTDVWKMPSDRSFDDRLVLMCNTHVDADTRSVDQGFVLRGHSGPVVALTCDDDKVVSASEDGSLIVWDAAKGTPSYSIRQHVDGDLVSSVDFNERYLVADGTSGSVYVWDYAVAPPPRRAPSRGKPSRRSSGMPPPPPPPNMPFVGGWNLGGGPTELSDIGGVMGLQPGGAQGSSNGGEEEGGSAAAAGGSSPDEDGGNGGGGRRGGRRKGWGGWGNGGGKR